MGGGMGDAIARATIEWISGPVVRARCAGPFALREAVLVGKAELLGEVVGLDGDRLIAQVYEDTTGLRPGDPLVGRGAPLSIRLGPGLLGGIFDGLLRPLDGREGIYLAPGESPRRKQRHRFEPLCADGDALPPGAPFGRDGTPRGSCYLVPPTASGMVESIAKAGDYADDTPLLTLCDAAGTRHAVAMSHAWPVRTPRPVRGRLAPEAPLVTGQRLIDALFPVALGGKAAIPGGFGTGKTVLLEALVKACAADVIVYLGCGERGNEMASVLEELHSLTDTRTGRPMTERTVIIANTSNMPVAAREASIYSAVTVAEYFRDQGLAVALMADSTSRWAEALREVSGRLGELPGEGGYPAYLGSRLAEFYERAGIAITLAGGTGSVTILGSVSPQAGDFSEPVTSHTTRYVRSFWALDVRRAQARFYPAIDPLQSYAEDAPALAEWWQTIFADLPGAHEDEAQQDAGNEWLALRRRFLSLLDEQARLERMARIVGKDALQPGQRLSLLCADVLNEAFLRQSAFSFNDRYCSPERQALMMRCLARFMRGAAAAVAAGATPEAIAALPALRGLQRMGEDIPDAQLDRFAALALTLDSALASLTPEPHHAS